MPGCTGLKQISQGKKKQPNVLFVMTDDHASHAMSCYGSKINRTPNLDRIANEWMLFDNCFCTNSICAPSRAVILTGKYGHVNGVIDNYTVFDGSQQTFPKLLQRAGYETAMIGKWHLKSDPTGFDYWHVLMGQGTYYNPKFKTPEGIKKYTGYTTDIVIDVGLDYLKNKRDKAKPFFMMLHHKAPHRWWQPGPKHLTMYDDVEIPEPDNLFDDYETRSDAARLQKMSIKEELTEKDLKFAKPGNFTEKQFEKWNAAYEPKNEKFRKANLTGKELIRWKYQRYIKDYLRCIASVDDNIGRVLDYLDEADLADNTIVIYTSDQGFYLGDHGWFDKRFMYEESLRMPLIIRHPGQTKAGSKSDDLVMNLDFGPTMLAFAGAKKPYDMQGESFKTILQSNTPKDWRKAIYYHYYEHPGEHMVKRHYGIRTQRYKLMHFYYDNIDAWELYDLKKDPREMNNVYSQASYKSIIEQLKTDLTALRKKYGDSDELAQEFIRRDLERARKRKLKKTRRTRAKRKGVRVR